MNNKSAFESSKMSDYRVHHKITELITLLRGSSDGRIGAEDYADLLTKSIAPYLTTQVAAHMAVKRLSENSTAPQEFLRKYDDLKAKNTPNLDAFVYLLYKIVDDEKTKAFLAANAKDRLDEKPSSEVGTRSRSHSTTKLSVAEFAELKDRLLKVKNTNMNLQPLSRLTLRDSPNNPEFPAFITDRPYMTRDYVIEPGDSLDPGAIMGAIPLPSQEHALLEDILFVLGGISGEHILAAPLTDPHGVRTFIIDETIDTSFKEMIRRILPLCSNFSLVTRFAEEKFLFRFGQVNNALAAAMDVILKDYFVLVAQLEHQQNHGQLTLQRLWFYLQPTMQTMEVLASVAGAINKSTAAGGVVLGMLHEKTRNVTGDSKVQELCLHLTQAACGPYFEILEKWIYKGIICDTFGEFLVEDNELVEKEELPIDYSDDYWEKRYTICRARVPVFLEAVSDMILRTGKYLNVIRQCGQHVKCPDAEEMAYTLHERQYVEKIEKAYGYASRKLLDLLMRDMDLVGRLRSVKHYFLLDQGDFIVQFLDMADGELCKNIDDIMPTRLESLLELALRTSVANNDRYKDDVRINLLPFDLQSQMLRIANVNRNDTEYCRPPECFLSGLEAFSFDYEVKWPLSLILNRKVVALYQMLFRQLLHLKHVERLLGSVWISNKVAKSFPRRAACYYAQAFALRQRMLNFVQHLEYYMMFEVLEPNWRTFNAKLQSVHNVDDVLFCHTDFLDTCLKDCMLTSPELLRLVYKLTKTLVAFSNFFLCANKYFVEAEMGGALDTIPDSEGAEFGQEPSTPNAPTRPESFEQTVAGFDKEFTDNLIVLLDRLSDLGRDNYNEKLVNILYRVDINGYYTKRLEQYAARRSAGSSSTGRHKKTKPPVPPKSPRVFQMGHTQGESSG